VIFNGDKAELNQYVRHLADLCGLRDWTVRVDIERGVSVDNHRTASQDQGAAGAGSRVLHGRQYVILSLDERWLEWDADHLRQTITHELVHAHTAKVLYAFYNVQNIIGNGALFDVLDSAFDDAHEAAVDAIAVAWAETLPLPVKAKKPRKKAAVS
jgi:hypothetical protein